METLHKHAWAYEWKDGNPPTERRWCDCGLKEERVASGRVMGRRTEPGPWRPVVQLSERLR